MDFPIHGLHALQEEQKGTIDGELATVLSSIALACKQIASLVTRAGISNLTGLGGLSNSSVSIWQTSSGHNSSWHTCSMQSTYVRDFMALQPLHRSAAGQATGLHQTFVSFECWQVCGMQRKPRASVKACFWTVPRATSASVTLIVQF